MTNISAIPMILGSSNALIYSQDHRYSIMLEWFKQGTGAEALVFKITIENTVSRKTPIYFIVVKITLVNTVKKPISRFTKYHGPLRRECGYFSLLLQHCLHSSIMHTHASIPSAYREPPDMLSAWERGGG